MPWLPECGNELGHVRETLCRILLFIESLKLQPQKEIPYRLPADSLAGSLAERQTQTRMMS
jgi:hypothetical protein